MCTNFPTSIYHKENKTALLQNKNTHKSRLICVLDQNVSLICGYTAYWTLKLFLWLNFCLVAVLIYWLEAACIQLPRIHLNLSWTGRVETVEDEKSSWLVFHYYYLRWLEVLGAIFFPLAFLTIFDLEDINCNKYMFWNSLKHFVWKAWPKALLIEKFFNICLRFINS